MLERLERMAPAMLAKEASEFWSGLVQFWEGNDLTVGDDYQSDSRAPVGALPGESVHLHTYVVVKRRLPCPGGGGQCVEVWMRSQADADDIERVTRRFVSELGFPEQQVTATLGEMAGSTEVTLVTEPGRLVPHRLTRTRAVRVAPAADAPKDAKPVDRRDESTWTFRYSAVPAR